MALRTFAYTPITIPPSDPFPNGHTAYRPYLIAHVVASTGQAIRCFVWPDSGADHCLFPLSFTGPLGLDPLDMKMHLTGGVGSVANATYYDTVRIDIPIANGPSISFEAYAGFTPGMDAQGIGLLGQAGFFEAFRVVFNHKDRNFSIEV